MIKVYEIYENMFLLKKGKYQVSLQYIFFYFGKIVGCIYYIFEFKACLHFASFSFCRIKKYFIQCCLHSDYLLLESNNNDIAIFVLMDYLIPVFFKFHSSYFLFYLVVFY